MCASQVKDDDGTTISWVQEVTCFICHLPGSSLEGFECPLCNRWLHLKCAGVDVRVFNEEYRENPSFLWVCVACLPKVAAQTPIVDIRSDLRLGAPICITARSDRKQTPSSSASTDTIPIVVGDKKLTGDSSDSGPNFSQQTQPSGERIISTNETDLAVWWDSESGSEVSVYKYHNGLFNVKYSQNSRQIAKNLLKSAEVLFKGCEENPFQRQILVLF